MKNKFVLILVILAMSLGIFQARPVVLADDSEQVCPHTIGYWKNHADEWPADVPFGPDDIFPFQEEGGILTYLEVLKKAKAKDMTNMLAAQAIAAGLSLVDGADASITETIQGSTLVYL